eukprot:scaffold62727_cov62-Phaeocystis_antarctica.AAC.3
MASRWRCAAPAWREGCRAPVSRLRVQRHSPGLLSGACPDSFRAARSGRVHRAAPARGWLLYGRETTAVWHADGAERLSAAERR